MDGDVTETEARDAEAAQVFLTRLHEEKLQAQERRGILIQRKVVWLTGLFAVGAIELPLEMMP